MSSSATTFKAWTRLVGSINDDGASALTTGSNGAIYVAGFIDGDLGSPSNSGSYDAFIAKFDPVGTEAWTQLLGAEGIDYINALTTGTDGAIYAAGYTEGNLDGQTNNGNGDAFIAKYNADGTNAWTKLIGSTSKDEANALTTGVDGAIYLAGFTGGNFDSQTNSGNGDAFITKYNADGTKAWTNLLGSGDPDWALALTTGTDGAIYLAGYTDGNLDGQTNNGNGDAFIAKYNADGTRSWTKLLGSQHTDGATALTTGNDGAIYVAGNTYGNLDGQPNSGDWDVFITKYNPDGTKSWNRSVASDSSDFPTSLTTGTDGEIYVAGGTVSGNLDGQTKIGYADPFITRFEVDGTKTWTRLLGSNTSDYDEARALTTGTDGSIYVAGFTDFNLDGEITMAFWMRSSPNWL